MYKMLKEDYQKLIAVGILTDGSFRPKHCRNTQIVEFYSNDPCLHEAFQDFMKLGFGRPNTSYYHYSKAKRVIVTGYELSKKDNIVKSLKKLLPFNI